MSLANEALPCNTFYRSVDMFSMSVVVIGDFLVFRLSVGVGRELSLWLESSITLVPVPYRERIVPAVACYWANKILALRF